jgi:hypothetical protein
MKKKRITVLLTINRDGSLKPFMIFKGKKNKNIDKELKLNPYASQGKIFAYTQENSWLDKDLFII